MENPKGDDLQVVNDKPVESVGEGFIPAQTLTDGQDEIQIEAHESDGMTERHQSLQNPKNQSLNALGSSS